MKPTRLTLFSFVLITMVMMLTLQSTVAKGSDTFRPGEINVSLAAGVDIATINARYGTAVLEQIAGTTIYRLRLPVGADVLATKAQLELDPAIVFAEPNYNYQSPEVRQSSQAFVDQSSQAFVDGQAPGNFFGQSSITRLHLAQAQTYTSGWGVCVAVIDTGLDFSHPLFAGRIAYPVYDFANNDGNPNDELGGVASGHGTFVAGLVAITAPQAGIMPIRAFGSDGFASSFDIAKAIRFATDNGAQIINMSFGLLTQEYLIKDAIEYATDHNVVLIAAAGNDNNSKIHFPALRNNVIAVTATDNSDRKAPFANFASAVSVCAPGVNLYSAYPGNRWAWWSGTSFATPLVSGEAALLLALNPAMGRDDLRERINSSGINPDPLNPSYKGKLGSVRIDFLLAVTKR